MEDIGQKIQALRKSKGMTLEELGEKVGVGKSTVRKWETGMIANMKRDKLAKIADALGVNPAYLMGWEEKKEDLTAKETGNCTVPNKLIHAIQLFEQLDELDQVKISGKMEGLIESMLEDEKYAVKEKSLYDNAPKTPEELEAKYPPVARPRKKLG